MSSVLEGVRVLDFGRYVAGPYCASVLADFGADVIRIEPPGGGDDRRLVPVTEHGEGSLYLQMNRNKRSLTLRSGHPEASEVRRRLIATADVIVINVPKPALKGMRLDYSTVSKIRPEVILVNVSCFGPVGSWSDRGGFDAVGQAMCGSVHLTGVGDQHFRTPITWVDHATGLHAAIGAMMALRERDRTGRGQEVEASLIGTALNIGATYLIEEALTGVGRSATGNRSFVNGPTDAFSTLDGSIVTQVVGDSLFKRWVKLMGEPEWATDPRFANDTLRGRNGDALSERMAAWCSTRSTQEALDCLAAAGVPAGPVLSPRQANGHPHIAQMNLFEDVEYPGLRRPASVVSMPVRLSETPADIRLAPPTAGQHNVEVLAELGYSSHEIEKLAGCGAI